MCVVWYFEEGGVVFLRVVWCFEDGGVVFWREGGLLKKVVCYFDVDVWKEWHDTLKIAMWYFDVVIWIEGARVRVVW